MMITKLLLLMMLLMTPILMTMILAPQTQKFPYAMRNRNNSQDADNYDAASPSDAVSPESLVYSKLYRKIDPRLMIKLKN